MTFLRLYCCLYHSELQYQRIKVSLISCHPALFRDTQRWSEQEEISRVSHLLWRHCFRNPRILSSGGSFWLSLASLNDPFVNLCLGPGPVPGFQIPCTLCYEGCPFWPWSLCSTSGRDYKGFSQKLLHYFSSKSQFFRWDLVSRSSRCGGVHSRFHFNYSHGTALCYLLLRQPLSLTFLLNKTCSPLCIEKGLRSWHVFTVSGVLDPTLLRRKSPVSAATPKTVLVEHTRRDFHHLNWFVN